MSNSKFLVYSTIKIHIILVVSPDLTNNVFHRITLKMKHFFVNDPVTLLQGYSALEMRQIEISHS